MENLKFKGTKGEWDYSFPEHDAKNIYIHAGSDMPLAKVPYNGNYSEANAKLIASAPELLDALQLLVSQLENEHLSEYCEPLIDKAKQAIEKSLK